MRDHRAGCGAGPDQRQARAAGLTSTGDRRRRAPPRRAQTAVEPRRPSDGHRRRSGGRHALGAGVGRRDARSARRRRPPASGAAADDIARSTSPIVGSGSDATAPHRQTGTVRQMFIFGRCVHRRSPDAADGLASRRHVPAADCAAAPRRRGTTATTGVRCATSSRPNSHEVSQLLVDDGRRCAGPRCATRPGAARRRPADRRGGDRPATRRSTAATARSRSVSTTLLARQAPVASDLRVGDHRAARRASTSSGWATWPTTWPRPRCAGTRPGRARRAAAGLQRHGRRRRPDRRARSPGPGQARRRPAPPSWSRTTTRWTSCTGSLFALLLGADWPHGVEAAVDGALLGRFYERFADHAVSAGAAGGLPDHRRAVGRARADAGRSGAGRRPGWRCGRRHGPGCDGRRAVSGRWTWSAALVGDGGGRLGGRVRVEVLRRRR